MKYCALVTTTTGRTPHTCVRLLAGSDLATIETAADEIIERHPREKWNALFDIELPTPGKPAHLGQWSHGRHPMDPGPAAGDPEPAS